MISVSIKILETFVFHLFHYIKFHHHVKKNHTLFLQYHKSPCGSMSVNGAASLEQPKVLHIFPLHIQPIDLLSYDKNCGLIIIWALYHLYYKAYLRSLNHTNYTLLSMTFANLSPKGSQGTDTNFT